MKWIDIKDELPEKGQTVLRCMDAKMLEQTRSATAAHRNLERMSVGEIVDEIGCRYVAYTHWMPLPNPPEEGE